MSNFIQYFLAICVNLAFCTCAFSQGIQIIEDKPISNMVSLDISTKKSTVMIEGFSVQIIVTQDRSAAEYAKTNLLRKFPDIKADLRFESPYYRLLAGVCVTKAEANALFQRLKNDYPAAYVIINHKINKVDLLGL